MPVPNPRRAQLRVVRGDEQIEPLLDAAARWLHATGDPATPAAYLEIGDDELRDEWPLTRGQVDRLAELLRVDTLHHRGHATPVRRDAATERRLGDLAARLVPVACDLACRVRDDGREAVTDLLGQLTAEEQRGLLVVLAAMVPDDRSAEELLAWVTWDEHGRPLPATPRTGEELRAAHTRYTRDRTHGQTPPEEVVAGERAYQRARKRRSRHATREEARR